MLRFACFLTSTALFVPAILLAERAGAPQLALGAATALFLIAFARSSPVPAAHVVWAVAIATTGEVVLSVLWGLYDYPYALIPLYVPFGHGVFYMLAAESAAQPFLRRHASAITRAVLIGGTVLAAVSLVAWNDQWGLLWWVIAAALLIRSRSQLLLATCFIYTLLLEWLGTALGNWRWAETVPGLGLHSANPPSGVGVLYIVLDLSTVAACALAARMTSSEGWKADVLSRAATASLTAAPEEATPYAGLPQR